MPATIWVTWVAKRVAQRRAEVFSLDHYPRRSLLFYSVHTLLHLPILSLTCQSSLFLKKTICLPTTLMGHPCMIQTKIQSRRAASGGNSVNTFKSCKVNFHSIETSPSIYSRILSLENPDITTEEVTETLRQANALFGEGEPPAPHPLPMCCTHQYPLPRASKRKCKC